MSDNIDLAFPEILELYEKEQQEEDNYHEIEQRNNLVGLLLYTKDKHRAIRTKDIIIRCPWIGKRKFKKNHVERLFHYQNKFQQIRSGRIFSVLNIREMLKTIF